MDTLIPTNSFASATLDIFNDDIVSDPTIDLNKLATIDIEESYFAEAIEFINKYNSYFTESKITLYKKITESTNSVVIIESFSDFFTKVKDIIDKFLKFLKSLFDRFVISIAKFIKSDKYIEKHKKDLDKFTSDMNFSIEGFNYTFNNNIPTTDVYQSYTELDPFRVLFANIKDLTSASIAEAISNIALEENYDKFRARILGSISDDPKDFIYESDFAEELFKKFRNDSLNTTTIDIDPAALRYIKDRYFNSNKVKEYINNSYKSIRNSYKRIEDTISKYAQYNGNININSFLSDFDIDHNITSVNGKKIDSNNGTNVLDTDIIIQLDNFVKIKLSQVQTYSNIHTLAFTAKLDAIKECVIQDRNTIYKALSAIAKDNSTIKLI